MSNTRRDGVQSSAPVRQLVPAAPGGAARIVGASASCRRRFVSSNGFGQPAATARLGVAPGRVTNITSSNPEIGSLHGRLVLSGYIGGGGRATGDRNEFLRNYDNFCRLTRCTSQDPTQDRAEFQTYHYRPWHAYRTSTTGTRNLQPWWSKLSRYGKVPTGGTHAIRPDQCVSSRIARSMPSKVSGNMRLSISARIMPMLIVPSQYFSGTGLSHTAFG